MSTCGTCRHKGENLKVPDPKTSEPKTTRFFLCDLIKHNAEAGANNGACFSHANDAREAEGTKAFVVDGSGYFAALCVEDDFGCVKWEAQEEAGLAAHNGFNTGGEF